MRLIDADEFQKQIAGMAILNNYPPNKANALCELVDNQPTAFDVENVVSNLEQLSLMELVSTADIANVSMSAGMEI